MGGQACILYGAAEFSRDIDFIVLIDDSNIEKLKDALEDLRANVIAVPPFELAYLEKGHSVHFRSSHPEVQNLRIDIMSRLRGVDAFEDIWRRRTTVNDIWGNAIELLAIEDLVKAKKTKRDKDWSMIRRLLESHYLQNKDNPSVQQIDFWLREMRTPELLINICKAHPESAENVKLSRKLITHAITENVDALCDALLQEEAEERQRDIEYWTPLRKELESLRHAGAK